MGYYSPQIKHVMKVFLHFLFVVHGNLVRRDLNRITCMWGWSELWPQLHQVLFEAERETGIAHGIKFELASYAHQEL